MDPVIAIPHLITGYPEIDDHKLHFLKSWETYVGPTPVMILHMGTASLAPMFDNPNITEFHLPHRLTTLAARYLLSLLAEERRYSHTLQIDDDFEVKPTYGPSLHSALKEVANNNHQCAWFHNPRRMMFTSGRHKPMMIRFCQYVSICEKYIEKHAPIWEFGSDFGSSYNTREGILIPVVDLLPAFLQTKDLMPSTKYQEKVLYGEDCLMLVYLVQKYGMYVRMVAGAVHHQFPHVRRIEDRNLSAFRNRAIETPMSSFRRDNDVDGILEDCQEVVKYLRMVDEL